MKITTPYGTLMLEANTTIAMTYTNPMFNEQGSHSLPFSVPWCEHNLAALGHPEMIHKAGNQPNFINATVELPELKEDCTITIGEITKGNDIELTILTREGAFWHYAKSVNMRETIAYKTSIDWYSARSGYVNGAYPNKLFAMFPLVLGKSNNTGENFFIVNNVYPLTDSQASYDVYTNKPALGGYIYLPFATELMFRQIGYRITESVFITDTELKSAVVLNNYIFEWDNPLFPGVLSYDLSKMLPNCTIAEFITAVEFEFGVVFDIDYQLGTVCIRKIKERITNTNFTKINGEITAVIQERKGFELSNSTTESPYSLTDKDFLQNNILNDIEIVNGGIIADEPITSGATPNRTTHPEKYVFCKATQTFFRLEWIYNETNEVWEYIPKSIHSNFSNSDSFNFDEKSKRESKTHSAPMVPNRISKANGWRPMLFPFYGKTYTPDYLFRSDSANLENFIVNDHNTAPISFAFYRGIVRFPLDSAIWGEEYWDLPYGSTDFFVQEDGREYGNFNYSLRHNGSKGVVDNWYKEYQILIEEIGFRFSLIHCNQHKEILKNLTGKFLCEDIPFLIEKMEVTLSHSGVTIESVDCISTKPVLND